MAKTTVDLEHFNDFLYCRVNKEHKKKLNKLAIDKEKKLYEILDEILKNI